MKRRCYSKDEKCYPNYGGRGITICDEWLGEKGFEHFYEWAMANGYRDDLSIDRIDNDGPYAPWNCRWATTKEQGSNRRTNVVIEMRGESHTQNEWAELLGVTRGEVAYWRRKGLAGDELYRKLTEKK